jgi:uncharacterized membrane protein YfcA
VNLHSPMALLLVGAAVGVFVGLAGTSGAVMIPALVLLFGLTQLKAQGTALFLALLPVWAGPLIPYARAHQVEWKMGLLLGVGLAVGGYVGASWAQHLPQMVLRRIFAVVLVAIAFRMFLQK